MDETTWQRVRSNIFKAAWPVALALPRTAWHTNDDGKIDADVVNSSQSIAIDIFGTLKQSNERSTLLNALASDLGLPENQHWNVEIEHKIEPNVLGEHRRTQIDAFAEGPNSFFVIECKFTEAGGGACSQPNPIADGPHKGLRQCNGRYELQVNPANGKRGFCALTEKGIRYWQHIPALFALSDVGSHSPCPFSGENYQWMRNIVLCAALSTHRRVPGGFILAFAARAGLSMSDKVASGAWSSMLRLRSQSAVPVRAISFQELVARAQSLMTSPESQAVWRKLGSWIDDKITRVSVP
jgi:hypothetical protein